MKIKNLIAAVMLLAGIASCANLDDRVKGDLYTAEVTVKTAEDNTVFLQLTDDVKLHAGQFRGYGKEVRALTQFVLLDENTAPGYDGSVQIMWIDTILTKKIIFPSEEGGRVEVPGLDPIDIYNDWMTCVEDGYLTLHVRSWGGMYSPVKHSLDLVKYPDSDPYEVKLVHNANGDAREILNEGIVAFSLDGLPDTDGATVKLKLKWTRLDGSEGETEFDYKTRK